MGVGLGLIHKQRWLSLERYHLFEKGAAMN